MATRRIRRLLPAACVLFSASPSLAGISLGGDCANFIDGQLTPFSCTGDIFVDQGSVLNLAADFTTVLSL